MIRDLMLRGVVRRTRLLDMDRVPSIDGHRFQYLNIVLRNNAGTLQHAFMQDAFAGVSGFPFSKTPWSIVSDKFNNIAPLGTYTNTPTVGAGTGFSAGLGLSTHLMVFDTVPLDSSAIRPADQCVLTYYQGNNTRVIPIAGFRPVNVLGSTIPRFCIGIWNAATGAAVNITTTWMGSSGNLALFTYWGYL